MYNTTGLIPAKFLTLIAHFTVLVSLLWSSEKSVKICLPENHSDLVFASYHTQLVVGMSMALGMIVFELIAFLSGFTMFNTTSALTSIGCHASACISLYYLVFDSWQCDWYWWIFTFCSVIPILNDFFIVFDALLNKRY